MKTKERSSIIRRKHFSRLRTEEFSFLHEYPSSMIADALERRCSLGPQLRPYGNAVRFVGSALTIRCSPGDNLAALVALDQIADGDVLVIACGASIEGAVLGGNYAAIARHRGAKAIVTDGLLRDYREIQMETIPIFAAGVSANGPLKSGTGEVGLPVTMWGQIIYPGDVLFGDEDGVIIVRRERIGELKDRIAAIQEHELAAVQANQRGELPAYLTEVIATVRINDLD